MASTQCLHSFQQRMTTVLSRLTVWQAALSPQSHIWACSWRSLRSSESFLQMWYVTPSTISRSYGINGEVQSSCWLATGDSFQHYESLSLPLQIITWNLWSFERHFIAISTVFGIQRSQLSEYATLAVSTQVQKNNLCQLQLWQFDPTLKQQVQLLLLFCR